MARKADPRFYHAVMCSLSMPRRPRRNSHRMLHPNSVTICGHTFKLLPTIHDFAVFHQAPSSKRRLSLNKENESNKSSGQNPKKKGATAYEAKMHGPKSALKSTKEGKLPSGDHIKNAEPSKAEPKKITKKPTAKTMAKAQLPVNPEFAALLPQAGTSKGLMNIPKMVERSVLKKSSNQRSNLTKAQVLEEAMKLLSNNYPNYYKYLVKQNELRTADKGKQFKKAVLESQTQSPAFLRELDGVYYRAFNRL